MTLDVILDGILTILILPLQVVFVPIDALLNQIPGVENISTALLHFSSLIGSLPSFIANFFGIIPFLWNAPFLLFGAYLLINPTIAITKTVLNWVRG